MENLFRVGDTFFSAMYFFLTGKKRLKFRCFPESFPLTAPDLTIRAISQETDENCGPAVIQTLLAKYRRKMTQDEIIRVARVKTRLKEHGTRPDQLARAVKKIAPNLQFWYKDQATVEDLDRLIHVYHQPVVINWQGLFYDTVEEEDRFNPQGEHGHYSLVVDIDLAHDTITTSDPYPEYNAQPRVFSLRWFCTRWWDVDHSDHLKNGKPDSFHTKHFLFIVARKSETFPASLGMQQFNT